MGKHTLKEWIFALRPWSFPASAMPIVVTLAYLFWKGAEVNWVLGNGVNWFRERGQWADNSAEPTPGMIIFFDWDDPDEGGQDGLSDHVGIVETVENGRVYTIEGNSGDSCRHRSYPLGYYEILGYGIPAY